jgi:hypothetical protein
LLQQTLIRWLHEVERSARHRMIMMQVSSVPLFTSFRRIIFVSQPVGARPRRGGKLWHR